MDENLLENSKRKKYDNEKNTHFVLFRNIVIGFCITWIILILVLLLLIKNINRLELGRIVTILVGIPIYIIYYLPKNINRLKILIKYKKVQIDGIEKSIKKIEKDNCFDNIYFFENYLVKMEKHYFEKIKYEDILWVFKEIYYNHDRNESKEFNSWFGYKHYGKFILITKDKKIHRMVYINKEQLFKNKLLEKNPNILFGRSNSITKKTKKLYNLNINILDSKIILYHRYIKFYSVIFILYWFYWLVLFL